MKNLKEVLLFGFLLQDSIVDASSDKKINLLDFPKFVDVIRAAGPAFTDIKLVKEEIQKMDEAAKAELYAWIKDEFDIADDAVEALIEKTLKVLIDLYQLATEYSENRKMKAA